MNYALDASCLIYFGKVRLLEKIGRLSGEKYITESIYREVVLKGLERREIEADYIKEIIERNIITITNPGNLIGDSPQLSIADREIISLAKEINSVLIMDEKYASRVAIEYGIEYHGSLYLILKLIEERIISKREAIDCIDEMIKAGFYLSSEKYREVLDIIEICTR